MKDQDLIELEHGNFISKLKLDRILREEDSSQLAERARNLRNALNKMETKGLESPEEKRERTRKVAKLLDRIYKVIREKDGKLKLSKIEREKTWAKNEVPRHFLAIRLFRYVYGVDADMLRSGMSKPHQIRWKALTSETIEIKTRSGRILKPNLLEKIPPNHWRGMLENPLNVYFYNTERDVVGLKDDKKPTSFWHPKEYVEAKKIKPIHYQTWLAIMAV